MHSSRYRPEHLGNRYLFGGGGEQEAGRGAQRGGIQGWGAGCKELRKGRVATKGA